MLSGKALFLVCVGVVVFLFVLAIVTGESSRCRGKRTKKFVKPSDDE